MTPAFSRREWRSKFYLISVSHKDTSAQPQVWLGRTTNKAATVSKTRSKAITEKNYLWVIGYKRVPPKRERKHLYCAPMMRMTHNNDDDVRSVRGNISDP
jgi:hypothetical protein